MAKPGRPSVSEEDVEAVSALLDTDRRLTVRELALEIGLSHMTVFRIVKKHHHFLENNLRPALRRKCPDFLQILPIILHDNALAHMAHPVADLYLRSGWKILFPPLHSPDLSPCDYDLIPKLKEPHRDIQFQTVPDILQTVGRSVTNIDRTGTAIGIRCLPHRWQRVVDNAGDYIEEHYKTHME